MADAREHPGHSERGSLNGYGSAALPADPEAVALQGEIPGHTGAITHIRAGRPPILTTRARQSGRCHLPSQPLAPSRTTDPDILALDPKHPAALRGGPSNVGAVQSSRRVLAHHLGLFSLNDGSPRCFGLQVLP